MTIRRIRNLVVLVLLVAFVILNVPVVYALDELFLTGILKSVDIKTKTVVVNVQSSTCHGFMTFTVDDASGLEDLVEQKIIFFIDSSTCKKKEIYKMLPGWRVKK